MQTSTYLKLSGLSSRRCEVRERERREREQMKMRMDGGVVENESREKMNEATQKKNVSLLQLYTATTLLNNLKMHDLNTRKRIPLIMRTISYFNERIHHFGLHSQFQFHDEYIFLLSDMCENTEKNEKKSMNENVNDLFWPVSDSAKAHVPHVTTVESARLKAQQDAGILLSRDTR